MVSTSRHGENRRYTHDDAKHEFFAGIVERCADAIWAAVGESRGEALCRLCQLTGLHTVDGCP